MSNSVAKLLAFLLLSFVWTSDADDNEVHVQFLKIKSDIYSRFATTLVSSRLANPTNESQEIRFTATLPEDAFISNFSMQIGDKIIVGNVKEKEQAKRDYEKAKSELQSTGLVAQKARETNSFTIYANVAAYDKVTFNLTYQEILVRIHGAYRHVVNIRSDKLKSSSDVDINVEIFEQGKIVNVHVPHFSEKVSEKTNFELLKAQQDPEVLQSTVELDGVSTTKVYYKVKPSKYTNGTLASQLVVLYDVERDTSGGQIQVYDGYFVHFFAPNVEQKLSKRVVFVLDKSGSMQGRKMEQTKQAMTRILRELQSDDVFNIIAFDDEIVVRSPEMISVTEESVNQAIQYVDAIEPDGGTNIYDSTILALRMLNQSSADDRVPMFILLTDGEATDGPHIVNVDIISRITEMNRELGAVIHGVALGVGYHFQLMQGLSENNHGLARKVYEDSDADLQLTGFYSEISSPMLSGLTIEYLNNSVDVSSLVKENQQYYYNGGELMTVGKLASASRQSSPVVPVQALVRGRRVEGIVTLESDKPYLWDCFRHEPGTIGQHFGRCPLPRPYPFVRRPKPSQIPDSSTVAGFIERMWAFKTIKKLLKISELQKNKAETARGEALQLSLKYGFVTEMTSMVVVQSNGDNSTTRKLDEGDDVFDVPAIDDEVDRAICSFGKEEPIDPNPACIIDIMILVVKTSNVSIDEVEPIVSRLRTFGDGLFDHVNDQILRVIVDEQLRPLKITQAYNMVDIKTSILHDLQSSGDEVLPVDLFEHIENRFIRLDSLRVLIWISPSDSFAGNSNREQLTGPQYRFQHVTSASSAPFCNPV